MLIWRTFQLNSITTKVESVNYLLCGIYLFILIARFTQSRHLQVDNDQSAAG